MLTKHSNPNLNLHNIAVQAMAQYGLLSDFPAAVKQEIAQLKSKSISFASSKDLRNLLWSSIDNDDSRDLDQIEFAQSENNDSIRIMIGIADVDAYVSKGSAIDQRAAANTTSVYTGFATFSMLPEELSFNLTSLNENQDRLAMVIDFTIDTTGTITSSSVYPAAVHNHAQLAYDDIGSWLEGKKPASPKISTIPGLADQLHLQATAMQRLYAAREKNGSLNLQTIETNPVISDGQILDIVRTQENMAHDIIENFMVAANNIIAKFLDSKNFTSLRRIVREPAHWDRIVELATIHGAHLPDQPDAQALAKFLLQQQKADPDHFPDLSLSIVKLLGSGEYIAQNPNSSHEGHFALAVHDYTHSTAPNRRYPDLITQRLLKAAIAGTASPYSEEDLKQIAQHCTDQEDAARKVERKMRKVAAAIMLSKFIGTTYDAIVTKASSTDTYIRLIAPPAEGKLVRNSKGLKVGDKIKVKLVSTNPEMGFLDFEKL